ncbi:hypothetical protein BBB56_21355 [Candidatus Pantoea deserta]|uniref:Transcriptional regulator TetR C-terminal Proteobacteria type domain-containing protein n=1 Tax=Candidatus Pantoea deserta TaxID=1869313 RepID=A0A3N4NCV6_9GAMM|nr:TetR/AcrR family transcriptional regulator C-terminal domain-containing protein [Pantoea deserta]RPD94232.1 hypothetical protein BBB56_21355 [Pantoea deserta]
MKLPLRPGCDRGVLKLYDPREAADDLAGLWLGMTSLEIKLGARKTLSDEEITHRVVHAIALFMRIYAVEP